MESAFIFMLVTFAVAVLTGALISWTPLAVALPLLIPIVGVMSKVKGGGPNIGETLLFVSPFLVAGLVIYGFVSLMGVRLGRWIHLGRKAKVQVHDRSTKETPHE